MHKNDPRFAKAEAKAVQMRKDGSAWTAILKATGLNHSQAEDAYLRATLSKADFQPFTPENVVALRKAGHSWGSIMIRLNATEGACRKAWKDSQGTLSEGSRIGKGGRFLNADPELYRDVLQPTGTAIPVAYGRMNARVAAAEQRLAKLDLAEVRHYAEDLGVATKGKNKAQITKAVLVALGITKPTAKVPAPEAKAS